VTFLTSEAFNLGHGYALYADLRKRLAHIIELEGLDYCFDEFHFSPGINIGYLIMLLIFILSDETKTRPWMDGFNSFGSLLLTFYHICPGLCIGARYRAKKRPGIFMPGQPHYQQESYFALINSG
jgi:hypothetical protein